MRLTVLVEAIMPVGADVPTNGLTFLNSQLRLPVLAVTTFKDEAEALAAKMAKGQFDMNDLRAQLGQIDRKSVV